MRQWTWMMGGAAALTAGFCLVLTSRPIQAANDAPVRIGLVKTLFRDVPDILIPLGLRPMKELMEGQTGVSGDLIPAGDCEHLAQQIKDDEVQFGVFHGVEFAWVHQHFPLLKPLVIAVNQHPYLRAVLVVRAEGTIATTDNLEGKVVALPRMSREHCRLFLERRCCPVDQEPAKFFNQLSTPFSVEDALDDVVDDNAQATVVDEVAYEAYQKNKPGRAAKLKVLQESEPFPCAVIVYEPGHVSAKTVQLFRDGLIGARDNPKAQSLLKANHITSFEAAPNDYDEELSDISKAYPQAAVK